MKKALVFLLSVVLTLGSFAGWAIAEEQEPYYIGMYLSQTGTSAGVGDNQLKGAQLAVTEINENGGILGGRPIELIVYDDASSPETAVKVVTRLVEEDKVDIILGGNLSPNILASSPVTEAAHVLHIGAGTGASWTNIGAQYLFRGTANGILPTKTFIEMMQDMGEKTCAIVCSDSEYGQSGHATIMQFMEDSGIEILADVTYQAGDADYTGCISQLLANNPDAIIQYGDSKEMVVFLRQLRQAGYTRCVYTVEGGGDRQLSELAGHAADGIVFSAAYVIPETIEEASSEMEAEFLQNYVDAYGEMPISDCAYRGYDQVYLAAAILNNSEDYTDREANRNSVLTVDYTGLAGHFDFSDGSGDGLTAANKYMLLDLKVSAYDRDAMLEWRDGQ